MRSVYIIFGILGALAGCSKEEVTQYKVPKEASKAVVPKMPPPSAQSPTDMQQQSMPGLTEQTEQFKTPTWDAPDTWEAQPKSAMRKGSFSIKEDAMQAEVTVLAFPGDVGGKLANINRWAGQIGMPALNDEAVNAMESIDVDGIKGTVVELKSVKANPQGVLGVIVEEGAGTWFFKMMGDAPLVESRKEEFLEFVKSVKFQ